jgi:MHS family proline/betaine transporter-like MFS transporter
VKWDKISSKQQFIITVSIVGSALEWFEFSLFGMMASLLIQYFLPKTFWESALFYPFLMILSTIARPIGGFVFGKIGDRQGRKFALVRTVGFMIIPLFLTAILPSYERIGLTALFLLAFIFLLQGFSLGGEFPGSVVFLIESAKQKMKGYFGSWVYFGAFVGMFLAALEVNVLTSNLPKRELVEWGWRLSFLLSAVIATALLFFRRLMHETPFFLKAKEFGHLDKEPLFDAFHKYKKPLFYGMMLLVLETVGFNFLVLFSSAYYQKTLHLHLSQITVIQLTTIFILAVITPLAGKASIRFGSKRLAKWAAFGILFTAFPLYYLICQGILWMIVLSQAILAVFLAVYLGNLPAMVCSLFPIEVRYSGVATVMNISVTIFASIGILIITLFINNSNTPLLPSLYWVGGTLLSLWGLTRVKDYTKRDK